MCLQCCFQVQLESAYFETVNLTVLKVAHQSVLGNNIQNYRDSFIVGGNICVYIAMHMSQYALDALIH